MTTDLDSVMNWWAATIFAVALVHVFSTKHFERMARVDSRHSGIWHLMGEIEIVFGFWAMVLILVMFWRSGSASAIAYLESRNFTEPMFVFVIMVIAGTRPVLQLVENLVARMARFIPAPRAMATYFLILAVVPPLGSFVTEPAAMTVAAFMLRDMFSAHKLSERLKYATLGVLFVNVSIGGTMTHFAAPPVLMVATKWQWDLGFMLHTFGWKSLLAVLINAFVVTLMFQKDLRSIDGCADRPVAIGSSIVSAVHVLFLFGVVVFAHHPVIFMALLLFFLGFTTAYKSHQGPLILREALLVAFFLAGLVVLGGQQQWWLQPLLQSMDSTTVFYGATALTAVTDNAALTYLGSLVDGLSGEFKVALVAGAVAGGGLTVIANAPNPAGATILKDKFSGRAIHPLGLFLAALPPTLVAIMAFRWL